MKVAVGGKSLLPLKVGLLPPRTPKLMLHVPSLPIVVLDKARPLFAQNVTCRSPLMPNNLLNLLEAPCIPQIKHISYPVLNIFPHPTHHVILYSGFYFCAACGATAVNKLIKLYGPWCIPLRRGPLNYNLKAYKAGKAPQGFPGWPYMHLHGAHTSVAEGVRRQIDSLAASYEEQQSELSPTSSQFTIIACWFR